MLILNKLIGFAAGKRYRALGVLFFGDKLTRGAPFTGIGASGTAFTLSFWFKPADANANDGVFDMNGNVISAVHNQTGGTAADRIRFLVYDTTPSGGGATLLDVRTSVLAYDVWHHIICSFNAATGAVRLYVNGVPDADITTATTGTIKFDSATGAGFPPQWGGTRELTDYADVWFNTSFIDLSDIPALAKFITSGGKPVDLGANGELVTGTSPIMYLSRRGGEAASAFGTNKGTGGGMTITGTLANSSTSPSD